MEEQTRKFRNRVTADPFKEEDLYDYQEAMHKAEIGGVLSRAQCAQFRCSNGLDYIVTPSLRESEWQVTTFSGDTALSDHQSDSIEDVLDALPDEGAEEVVFVPGREAKTMTFENSKYVSPNGTAIEDGLNSIADPWSLRYAQATLIAGGFAQIYGPPDALQIVVDENHHLTEGQRNTLQNVIYDSVRAGNDVTIKTLSGKSTTLLEEDNGNIAKIHGWLVKHGDFAHGKYIDDQEQTIDRTLSRTRDSNKSLNWEKER